MFEKTKQIFICQLKKIISMAYFKILFTLKITYKVSILNL